MVVLTVSTTHPMILVLALTLTLAMELVLTTTLALVVLVDSVVWMASVAWMIHGVYPFFLLIHLDLNHATQILLKDVLLMVEKLYGE